MCAALAYGMLACCFMLAWVLTVSKMYMLTPVPSLVYSYLPSRGRVIWSISSKSQGAFSCVCRVLIGVTVPPAAVLVAFAVALELATVPTEGTVELVSAASGAAAAAVDEMAVAAGVAAVVGEVTAGEAVEAAVAA